jgi:hypothetical protein
MPFARQDCRDGKVGDTEDVRLQVERVDPMALRSFDLTWAVIFALTASLTRVCVAMRWVLAQIDNPRGDKVAKLQADPKTILEALATTGLFRTNANDDARPGGQRALASVVRNWLEKMVPKELNGERDEILAFSAPRSKVQIAQDASNS